MDEVTDRQFATSLARGLDVLQCFKVEDVALSNSDICLRTGLPKATVSRLTYTLSKLGYLRFIPGLGRYGRYALGSALVSISHPLLANLSLRQASRGSIDHLAEATQSCVSVSVRDRAEMVTIASATPKDSAIPLREVGSSVSILDSVVGAAFLAALAAEERARVLPEIGVDPRHPLGMRPWLTRCVKHHIAHGFCIGTGHGTPGNFMVATAVRPAPTGEIYVFGCSLPARAGVNPTPAGLAAVGRRLVRTLGEAKLAFETAQ